MSDFPGEIITINFVHTTPDLALAKVYLLVSSDSPLVYQTLKNNANHYRHELADKLFLRKMPKIEIIQDEMQDQVDRIEQILDKEH